jgi:hypothetical protein
MPSEFLDDLTLGFYRCAQLPREGGAAATIRLFQQLGGRFLDIVGIDPEPDPFRTINANGDSIALMKFAHEKLVRDAATLNDILREQLPPTVLGRAGFSFVQDTHSVHLYQAVWSHGQTFADQLALGLLYFGLYLYPHLRPHFGFIDELGCNEMTKAQVNGNRLPYLYWANFFGPEFVRQLGPGFFAEGMPGWHLINLSDGGRLYVATESFTEWWLHDQDDIVAYFRRRFPRIKQYRAKPLP